MSTMAGQYWWGFFYRHAAILKWTMMIVILTINILCLRTIGLNVLNAGQPAPQVSGPNLTQDCPEKPNLKLTNPGATKQTYLNHRLSKQEESIQLKSNQTGLPQKESKRIESKETEPRSLLAGLPIQHVYYLKIHKTGSSTIFAIMSEYSRSHDLLPLLPQSEHINLQAPLIPEKQLILSSKVKYYDMVFNHHVYDPAIFTFLHNDTFKITTLREPFKQFVSSIMYFKANHMPYLQKLNSYSDPITAFLLNRTFFETTGYNSYTNNRQCIDLGFGVKKEFFINESYIRSFIAETEKRFDLVLIVEYFMESIVLMRRALNWQTQDVLFYVKNAFAGSHTTQAHMTDWHRARHSEFSQPDIRLYQHFLTLFKQKMAQAVGLKEEIAEFKNILEQVRNFCDQQTAPLTSSQKRVPIKVLDIPAGRWTTRVSVSKSKCIWLKLDEATVTRNLKTAQRFILAKI